VKYGAFQAALEGMTSMDRRSRHDVDIMTPSCPRCHRWKEGYKKFGPFHFFQFLEHAARSRASHWISQCDA